MKKFALLILSASLVFTACRKEKIDVIPVEETPATPTVPVIPPGKHFTQKSIVSQDIILNPSGYAPLTAKIYLQTNVNTRVKLRVIGKNGPASDITNTFNSYGTNHELDVMGLYGDYDNLIEMTLYTEGNDVVGSSSTIILKTDPLHTDLPEVKINKPATGDMASTLRLVSYLGKATTADRPNKAFVIDNYGDIRWYLDFTDHPVFKSLSFNDGIEMLKNGNLYFGDNKSNAIYEIDLTGEILNSWQLNGMGYKFHHQALEMPNGNFLIAVDKIGLNTIEDFIIEVDRNTKQLVQTWDLRQSLQMDRKTWTDNEKDWMHVNAVAYDVINDQIIVSGRTQGVVKLDRNNNVVWIMAPHRGWGLSGKGIDLNNFLLQPVDAGGNAITDTSVLNGWTNHQDFEWNWYQHAPKILPNGHILLFDNGDNRNYTGSQKYSRAVEYRVDNNKREIKQVWQYGKQRGEECYSQIVSDADYETETNSVVFAPGACQTPNRYGKIVEVDKGSSSVLFEATVVQPENGPRVTFHRTMKIKFY